MTTEIFDTYSGGKAGCYWYLINAMPPHRMYVEAFLGGGAVWQYKLAAEINIGLELDCDVVGKWHSAEHANYGVARCTPDKTWLASSLVDCPIEDNAKSSVVSSEVLNVNAIEWLESDVLPIDALVYCDPPYLPDTRRQPLGMYKHEMSVDDHIDLLSILRKLNCMVLLSGYQSELYDDLLDGWSKATFTTNDRAGNRRTEVLWANYELPPTQLHDTRYVGDDWRERQRIRRRKKRKARELLNMSELERQAILQFYVDCQLIESF